MNCLLCGSEKTTIVDTKIRNVKTDSIKVYICKKCGVHFLNPRLTEEELEEYYNGEYRKEYTEKEYYSREKLEEFFKKSLPEATVRINRVKQYINKEDEILEIGCSSGYFLYDIRNKVKTVYGTEWDENNLRYCKELGINVAKNPPDFHKKFDKIFLFHVLEHIKNPISFMKSLKEQMKDDNSMIFIEVPNNQDILLNEYDIPEFKSFYYQSAHLWYFNTTSLSYVLNEAGYEFEIHNIQRYDISNHLYWLKHRNPGGQEYFNEIFNDELKKSYVDNLINTNRNDTLFAIAYKNK
ncbi:class I SAM-dependent methyltransferase [Clostridium beijerinckii]|uniref:class I SAM-dependent methyltransferase n=1 Tax=Clostridium beijerinckii TaxID=1520 RepID=UPI000685970A|nr:class I SAM-dependent methyltransferase [Clostridium beijerinckii]